MLLIKVLFIKKACNVVFQSSKNEEITLPDEFIFMFIRYFNRVILLEKSCQKRGVWKKQKDGGRFKPSAHYGKVIGLSCLSINFFVSLFSNIFLINTIYFLFVIIINVLQYFFQFSFHGSIQAILMSVIRLRKLDPKIEF